MLLAVEATPADPDPQLSRAGRDRWLPWWPALTWSLHADQSNASSLLQSRPGVKENPPSSASTSVFDPAQQPEEHARDRAGNSATIQRTKELSLRAEGILTAGRGG